MVPAPAELQTPIRIVSFNLRTREVRRVDKPPKGGTLNGDDGWSRLRERADRWFGYKCLRSAGYVYHPLKMHVKIQAIATKSAPRRHRGGAYQYDSRLAKNTPTVSCGSGLGVLGSSPHLRSGIRAAQPVLVPTSPHCPCLYGTSHSEHRPATSDGHRFAAGVRSRAVRTRWRAYVLPVPASGAGAPVATSAAERSFSVAQPWTAA